MTVWKFATIVSSSCGLALSAFAVFLFLQADRTTKLGSHDVAVLVGAVLYLELFIFTLVSFSGYFFKTFGKIRKYDDLQTMIRRVGPSDLRGILVSIALVIVTLLIGKYFFNLGR
jgi:hypothetical protein